MSESARSGLRAAKSKALPFHACWYPLALSSELGAGEIRGVNFLGGRVVVYRTEQGEAQVRSAYCRHLGADLSVGKVVGEMIQCPFHHWRYDGSGVCIAISAGRCGDGIGGPNCRQRLEGAYSGAPPRHSSRPARSFAGTSGSGALRLEPIDGQLDDGRQADREDQQRKWHGLYRTLGGSDPETSTRTVADDPRALVRAKVFRGNRPVFGSASKECR